MKSCTALFSISLLLLASAASAQVVKTPPLQDGDTYSLPIDIHVGSGPTQLTGDPMGWAGAIVTPHVLDASELDVNFVLPATGFIGNALGPPNVLFPGALLSPFGPPSANVQSVPLTLNIFATPTATNSGLPSIASSMNIFLGSIEVEVKGSSAGGNSDVDLTAMLWNIWHVGTATMQMHASDLIWLPAAQTNITPFVSPLPGGLQNTTGHWVHNALATLTVFAPPSVFFATFAGTIQLGIEHLVPEPVAGTLLGLGLFSLGLHFGARRRRLRAD